MQEKQWFIERVGKIVCRDYVEGDGVFAEKLGKTMISIDNVEHAVNIFNVQNLVHEKTKKDLNYTDV